MLGATVFLCTCVYIYIYTHYNYTYIYICSCVSLRDMMFQCIMTWDFHRFLSTQLPKTWPHFRPDGLPLLHCQGFNEAAESLVKTAPKKEGLQQGFETQRRFGKKKRLSLLVLYGDVSKLGIAQFSKSTPQRAYDSLKSRGLSVGIRAICRE